MGTLVEVEPANNCKVPTGLKLSAYKLPLIVKEVRSTKTVSISTESEGPLVFNTICHPRTALEITAFDPCLYT